MTVIDQTTSISETLDQARQQTQRDYARLLWRSIEHELTAEEKRELVECCRQLSLSGDDVTEDLRHIREYVDARKTATTLPAIDQEIATIKESMRKIDEAFEAARQRALKATKPLTDRLGILSTQRLSPAAAAGILETYPGSFPQLFLEKPQ
jgi:hypothetical protein